MFKTSGNRSTKKAEKKLRKCNRCEIRIKIIINCKIKVNIRELYNKYLILRKNSRDYINLNRNINVNDKRKKHNCNICRRAY